jgi:hypothetical protein
VGQLPNLFVIGAMKCGTSSLHRYLDLHPEIAMSATKELNYFLPVDAGSGAGAAEAIEDGLLAERSNRGRGRRWYESQFGDAPIRGESSVSYSFPWFPDVAATMAAEVDDPRFVYVVRDPIERMLSHRHQFIRRDTRSTVDALLDEQGPYLQATRYTTALRPFLDRFDRERLLIVDQARLRHEREDVLTEILGFLGLDPAPVISSPDLAQEWNVTASKGRAFQLAERVRSSVPGAAIAARLPKQLQTQAAEALRRDSPDVEEDGLDADQVARLLTLLEPEIAGLEELTGWDLADWRG